MLRVKDNIDLKELEKYGFQKEHWGYIYYPNNNHSSTRYYSSMKIDVPNDSKSWRNRTISFSLENMSMWCNSIEELEADMENIKASYEAFKIKIENLIKADLIEKADDK